MRQILINKSVKDTIKEFITLLIVEQDRYEADSTGRGKNYSSWSMPH